MVSFVFLDGKSYVLDNLMRLRTVPLLYYLARKNGRKSIYMIRRSDKEKEVGLHISDERSADLINFRQPQALFRKNLVSKVYPVGKLCRIDSQGEEFEELMCSRLPSVLKEQEDAVIIMDLSVFSNCFRSMPRFREVYLPLAAARENGHVIYLVAENQNETAELLVGKDSIFRMKVGESSLSPELTEIMENAPDMPLFQEMCERMGTGYCLIRDYDEKGIRNTVLRVQLNRADRRLLSPEELERIPRFLMWCRNSKAYHIKAGVLSEVCHASSTEELEQLLMQSDLFEEVRKRARLLSWKEEPEATWMLPDWMEKKTRCIEILKKVRMSDSEVEKQVEGFALRLEDIIRKLSCVRASGDDSDMEEDLADIADIMESAAAKDDYLTFNCGLEALEKRIDGTTNTQKDLCKIDKARLRCSARLFQLSHDIMQCQIDLSEESGRQKQSRTEAAAFIAKYPWLKTVIEKLKDGSSETLDTDTHIRMMEFTRLTKEAARYDISLRAGLSRLHNLQQEYEQESRQFEQLKYHDYNMTD